MRRPEFLRERGFGLPRSCGHLGLVRNRPHSSNRAEFHFDGRLSGRRPPIRCDDRGGHRGGAPVVIHAADIAVDVHTDLRVCDRIHRGEERVARSHNRRTVPREAIDPTVLKAIEEILAVC